MHNDFETWLRNTFGSLSGLIGYGFAEDDILVTVQPDIVLDRVV